MDFLLELIIIAITLVLAYIAGQSQTALTPTPPLPVEPNPRTPLPSSALTRTSPPCQPPLFLPLSALQSRRRSAQHHLLPTEQQLPMPVPFSNDDEDEDDDDDDDDDDLEPPSDDDLHTPPPPFKPSPSVPPPTHSSLSPQSPLPPSSTLPSPSFIASTKKRRVVIVAKQLPVRTSMVDGRWQVEWEDTRNFLSALQVLHRLDQIDVKWVGCPNSNVVIPPSQYEEYEDMLYDYDCIPVFLPGALSERFYKGFCKGVMWPLLHYVMPKSNEHFGEVWDDNWQAYTAANTLYASVVTHAVETPTDIIWIQNYHLLLLPSFLRTKLPRSKIGLFIHTPFPSSDVFRVLPTRQNILSSMLATDLIGFHTFDYARHFLSCIKRVMDLDFETLPGGALGVRYNGRFVSITISHVGIDSAKFAELTEEVQGEVASIQRAAEGRQIVLGIDDYDPVKGVMMKVFAYKHFLSSHPEWASRVKIIQILHTSQTDDPLIRRRVLAELANLGDAVTVVEKELSMRDITAYYSASSVCIVSTFWDGLNLTPYEYSASQPHEQPGVLIISEFMGCSRSLNGVLRVNPWSLVQMADALVTALSMSDDERRANHSRRYQYVMNHSIERWGLSFLEQLDKATKFQSSLNYVQVGWGSNVKLMGLRSDFAHLEDDAITTAYRKAGKRVILLDYDGTLTPLEKSSEGSRLIHPSATIKRILRALCEDEDNDVFIMTGRTRSVLTDWFDDIPQLGLAAEKGLFLRWPRRRMAECRYDGWVEENSRVERAQVEQRRRVAEATAIAEGRGGEAHVIQEDSLSMVVTNDWECLIPLDDITWKETALSLILSYTEQTDGSWIEPKEYAIVWHYENADPEYGRMQASELQKYLVKILANPSVDVVKYDYARLLEVKPHGISKGLAANAILESLFLKVNIQKSASSVSLQGLSREQSGGSISPVAAPTTSSMMTPRTSSRPASPGVSPGLSAFDFNPPAPFLLCVGDDRSDEDMFVAINNREYLKGMVRDGVGDLGFRRSWSSSQREREEKERAEAVVDGPGLTLLNARRDDSEEEKWDADALRHKHPPSPFTFTVCVGMKPSNAHYFLHDDDEVLKMLLSLATCSQRMAQTRLMDNANLANLGELARTYSVNTMANLLLARTQTMPGAGGVGSGGSASNLVALMQANSLSVASGQRAALAAVARGFAVPGLQGRGSEPGRRGGGGGLGSPARRRVSEEEEDEQSGEEQEYGSGSEDEDGDAGH